MSPVERWAWRAIALNAGLGLVHALVAASSGSLAVAAELARNGAAVVAAVAVLIGVKPATRRAPRFPYGLHKVENLVAIGVRRRPGVPRRLRGRAPGACRWRRVGGGRRMDWWRWWCAPRRRRCCSATRAARWAVRAGAHGGGTAAPLLFSHSSCGWRGRWGSPALVAQAREYRVHVATTGLVLVALVAGWVDAPIDRAAAVVIAVVVVKTGWDLLSDAMRVLLDASLDRHTLADIERAIAGDVAVSEVTWVRAAAPAGSVSSRPASRCG